MKIVIVWVLRLFKKIINAKPATNDLVKRSDNGLITNDNADVCSENADSFLLEEDNKYNLTELDVLECIKKQKVFNGISDSVAHKIKKGGRLKEYKKGDRISKSGEKGDWVFLIFSGSVKIMSDNCQIDSANEGECVGEMSILDPTKKRCATIISDDTTVIYRVAAEVFREVLLKYKNQNPIPYNLAQVMSSRLRRRAKSMRVPNSKPTIFIGSSSEASLVLNKVKKAFPEDDYDVHAWTDDDVFRPSVNTMSSIRDMAELCDFAILIFASDDKLLIGDVKDEKDITIRPIPRDNVVLEAGYFMGVLGVERTFIMLNGAKMPSDFHGLTYLPYKGIRNIKIDEAVKKIKMEISKKGVRV